MRKLNFPGNTPIDEEITNSLHLIISQQQASIQYKRQLSFFLEREKMHEQAQLSQTQLTKTIKKKELTTCLDDPLL